MLAIEVEFLLGRAQLSPPGRVRDVEWPPHPVRLFYALVDALYSTPDGSSTQSERRALLALERQPPPHVFAATDAHRRVAPEVYVPTNDVAAHDVHRVSKKVQAVRVAITKVEQAQRRLQEAHNDSERQKAAKAAERAHKRLLETLEALDNYLQRTTRQKAPDLLTHKERKLRSFPVVVPSQPTVLYLWPEWQPDDELRATLAALCARVVRLGHSSSMVACRVVDEEKVAQYRDDPQFRCWQPTTEQRTQVWLRVPTQGLLQELTALTDTERAMEGRILPTGMHPYRQEVAVAEGEREPVRSVLSGYWISLCRVDGPWLPACCAPEVAEAVRRALLAHAPEPIPSVLSGHRPDGSPLDQPHLAVLPLPWVGHRHADGALRGVALVLPQQAQHAVPALETALQRWLDRGNGAAPLRMGRLGVWLLERSPAWTTLQTLDPWTWVRPARRWVTVTPIALDRNPGKLFSPVTAQRERAWQEAEATVRAACQRIGLPEPADVTLDSFGFVPAVRPARDFAPFPRRNGPGRFRRVLLHARLIFPCPVEGPVVLGAGRYQGLGLCMPEGERHS